MMNGNTCVRCSGKNDNSDGQMCIECSSECICPECSKWVSVDDMCSDYLCCTDCYIKVLERAVFRNVRYIDVMQGAMPEVMFKRIVNKFEPGLYDLDEVE